MQVAGDENTTAGRWGRRKVQKGAAGARRSSCRRNPARNGQRTTGSRRKAAPDLGSGEGKGRRRVDAAGDATAGMAWTRPEVGEGAADGGRTRS